MAIYKSFYFYKIKPIFMLKIVSYLIISILQDYPRVVAHF